MQLASYRRGPFEGFGALSDDRIIDLNRAFAARAEARGETVPRALADAVLPADAVGFLRGGDSAFTAAEEALEFVASLAPEVAVREGLSCPPEDVTLLPPVPDPPKIICVARNFAQHAKEAGLELPELPILFARFSKTLIADGQPVIRPKVSDELDWEGELAVVIGKPGRHVGRDAALDHVAGYSVFNDVTVRDFQFRVTQYTAGKNFDASGPFGPYLVTKDEVPDPHDLTIETTLSGETVQRASTAEMIFDIPTIIEHISEFIGLEAGDVIAMGTPAGVGFKRTPPRFLVPGDEISVSIEGIGTLSNPVKGEE